MVHYSQALQKSVFLHLSVNYQEITCEGQVNTLHRVGPPSRNSVKHLLTLSLLDEHTSHESYGNGHQ